MSGKGLRRIADEGARYLAASAVALAVDFIAYVALARAAQVHYLLAAPIGFGLGLATIYALSIRWVFAARRFSDARVEFVLFASIGLAGMALNQSVIYFCVARLAFSLELAKLVSAATVFAFNFACRKLLLFRVP